MSIADDVWDQVEKLGFEKDERPEGFLPNVPYDISSLDNVQLMVLYGQFVAWTSYAACRVAEARMHEQAAKQNLALSTACAMALSTEKSVSARKAEAAGDERVQADETAYLNATALREALEVVHKNASDRAAFCSRDLTRRQQAARDPGRTDGWAA